MLQPPKPWPPPPIHLHTAVRALFSKGIWSHRPPAQHPSVAPQCSEAKPWLLQHLRGEAGCSVPMLTHPSNLIPPGLWVSCSFPLNEFFSASQTPHAYLCLCFLLFFYLPHPWWFTSTVLQVRRKPSQAPQLSIKTPRGVLPMPPDAVTPAQFDLDWWVDGKLWQQGPQLAWPQCLTLTGAQECWRTSWNFKSTCSSV